MKGLIELIVDIGFKGDRAKARDTLGRVYEYFLGKFAQAEGKLGGEFFTPRCIVRLLVEMLEPYEGRVYDPCCGSAGMFVQSERFVEAHGGQKTDISIFGQESNPTTWRLAHMNLTIRGIEANLGSQPADSFLRNLHPDLKADYILANPLRRPHHVRQAGALPVALPAGVPHRDKGALTAEAVVVVPEERIFSEDFREDAGHRRMVKKFLQSTLVALSGAVVDFGLHRFDFRFGQDGRQQDPTLEVEEELLLFGHGHGRGSMVAHGFPRWSLGVHPSWLTLQGAGFPIQPPRPV